jgi:hypothetical protein
VSLFPDVNDDIHQDQDGTKDRHREDYFLHILL